MSNADQTILPPHFKPVALVLTGPSNVGKTTCIQVVHAHCCDEYPRAEWIDFGQTGDLYGILKLDRFRIGFASQGDPCTDRN